MGVLTRDSILQSQDLPTETVAVPEWGGDVVVRGLTAAERDALDEASLGPDRQPSFANYRAKLVAATVVGADGKRMFTPADVGALGAKSAIPIGRVFEAAQRLSGLRQQDVDALAKNSGGAPGDVSSSA